MLKAEEIRKLNSDEISQKIDELKKEHFNLRVQSKTGKLEKQHKIKIVKRNIARLLTIQKDIVTEK